MVMGGRRALVIANPVAGGQPVALVAELLDHLVPSLQLETVWTTDRSEAVEVVAAAVAAWRQGSPLAAVIAVGGDGTAREVGEGLARGLDRWPAGLRPQRTGEPDSPPALLVVPAGTGNSVYRSLWADRPWTEVLADVLGSPPVPGMARIRHLDLGRVVEADRAVLLGASTGFLADVVRMAESMGEVHGRERYGAASGRALADMHAYPGRVVVDDVVLYEGPVTLVALGGARHRAGTFQLLPRSVLDDGLLDVCVVGEVTVERFVTLAGLLPEGEHVGQPEVRYGQGRHVVLERTDGQALAFEHDGDSWAREDCRLTIDVVPGAVPAFAPFEALAG
jgi:diacylglycerol kinase (ATP)